MALQQAVGAEIAAVNALPATHNPAGFAALTFKPVGFIQSVPDLDGEHDIASFDDLSTGEEYKFADMLRAGEGTFQVGLDSSNAGQAEVEGNVGKKLSFEFKLKSGTKYYRIAVVKSFKPTNITVGGVVMADVALAFEKTTVKV